MIVHDLYVFRTALPPNEADTPLAIDPDRMLSPAIALERLEVVAGGRAEVSKYAGCM
jgi:hypothetical protein